jgi:hypothetical protein
MKQRGILLDPATGDLAISLTYDGLGLITSGIVIGDVTQQNKTAIILNYAGAFKLSPTVGVGIADMLNDENPLHWRTEIRKQLAADGMTVKNVAITPENIIIDANY